MIRAEEVKGRFGDLGRVFVVHYETPKGKGSARFGGHKARENATEFAYEKLQELLDKGPL